MKGPRIVGIDPGTESSGLAILDKDGKIYFGKVFDNFALVEYLETELFAGDEVSIESIKSYGRPLGETTLETCVWIGRFIQAALAPAVSIFRYTRKEIVTYLCKMPQSGDKEVRAALLQRYKEDPGLKGFATHMWSALAAATYRYDGKKVGLDDPCQIS